MVGLVSFPLDKIAVNPSLPHIDKEKRIGPHGPIPELLPQSTWHPASSQTPLQDGAARAKSLAARMGLQGWGCMGRFATMAMRFWRNMHILRQIKRGKRALFSFLHGSKSRLGNRQGKGEHPYLLRLLFTRVVQLHRITCWTESTAPAPVFLPQGRASSLISHTNTTPVRLDLR